MNANLKNTLTAISELKSEDIVSVINAVRNRQKELNTIAGAAARMMFTVGAKVRVNGSSFFFSDDIFSIVKINRTRCIVKKESTGQSYRVPMSMLEIKEVA